MTNRILKLMILISLVAPISPIMAQADNEADRLRDALRSATAQTRQLEDERTALQAKVADAERAAAAAKQEVQKVRKEQREAIEQFNKRLIGALPLLQRFVPLQGCRACQVRERLM